jgi:hypothetical protein
MKGISKGKVKKKEGAKTMSEIEEYRQSAMIIKMAGALRKNYIEKKED